MGKKLVPCKACGKEAAKAAKKCPHCGTKLRMGGFSKFMIVVAPLVVIIIALAPSKEERAAKFAQILSKIEQASPSKLSPRGELYSIFRLGSNHTDIQRDNKEQEITGQIVEWSLPVYEVDRYDDRYYKVQTSEQNGTIGAFLYLAPQSDAERQKIESLKTGSWVKVQGEISDIFLRNIVIKPAILSK